MQKMNVGFIGAGNMANYVHYPSLSEMQDVKILAICDLIEERLNATAQKYQIPYQFRDYREMLDKVKLDAIYIIMPPQGLKDIALHCLSKGKHIFIEKPPGMNLEETKQMAEMAKKHNCKSLVAFNRRYTPVMTESKKMVEEKSPVILGVGEFHKHHLGDEPYLDTKSWIICDIIHTVDSLRWMSSKEVEKVVSNIGKIDSPYNNCFTALLKFSGDTRGVLCANYISGVRKERFEIHGKGISAYIEPPDFAQIYKDNNSECILLEGQKLAGSSERHRTYGFFNESRHFIDCLKGDKQPDTSLDDAVKTMELIQAIEKENLTAQS